MALQATRPAFRAVRATLLAAGLLAATLAAAPHPAAAQPVTVAVREIDDLKAVFGTVESVHTVSARARVNGTIEGVDITEGSWVEQGQRLGLVRDDKLPLELAAVEAQVAATRAQREQAMIELGRAQQLRASGTAPQQRLDDAQTALTVVTAQLAAVEARRNAVQAQLDERAVLAPASGRVLQVPVVNGTVIMAGESVATIASEGYVLRLYLPERHARSLHEGDTVSVGAGGLSGPAGERREGRVRRVYPRLDQGRVVADVTVDGLGDFHVGQRVRVFLSAGRRAAIVVPRRYVFRRFDLDYVRLQDGTEVVVRTGQPAALAPSGEAPAGTAGEDGIEVLSGLRPGDVIVPPAASGG